MIIVQLNEQELKDLIASTVRDTISGLPTTTGQADDKLYSVEEIAQKFGVTSRSILTWEKKKIIPSVRVAGTLRFRFNAVMEAIEKRRKK